jgi:CTP synthase (UTP-ammonia lyase)
VLGIRDAEHEETAPHAERLLVSQLACSLVGQSETITILPGTVAHRAYGQGECTEQYRCNYGLNPAYKDVLDHGGLQISGVGSAGEVRLVELPRHRYFIATLFLPQLSSTSISPHPLITAYLRAAMVGHRQATTSQEDSHLR